MGIGESSMGQKSGGRLTKILPVKQTHVGEFIDQPFGKNIFSRNTPKQFRQLLMKTLNPDESMQMTPWRRRTLNNRV